MRPNTHLRIQQDLCGVPTLLEENTAQVTLTTTQIMAADELGLVHGGFIFGAADYAAMLAVNDPNVVLGAAECRFVAPVRVGDQVHIVANITLSNGKKRTVETVATVNDKTVMTATFTTFVLENHVLSNP